MKCHGLHCDGCRGGGGLGLAVIVVVVLIAATAKAASKAITGAGHVLAVVLEVAAIGLAVLVAAAVVAGITWAGVRIHRRHASRARLPAAAADRRPLSQPIRIAAEVLQSDPHAIEAPRPQLAGVPGIHEEVNR